MKVGVIFISFFVGCFEDIGIDVYVLICDFCYIIDFYGF